MVILTDRLPRLNDSRTSGQSAVFCTEQSDRDYALGQVSRTLLRILDRTPVTAAAVFLSFTFSVTLSGQGLAEDKTVRLLSPASLADAGLLTHILPRFKLKTGIAVTHSPVADPMADYSAPAPDEIWFVVDTGGESGAGNLRPAMERTTVFHHRTGAGTFHYVAVVLSDGRTSHVQTFIDWLVSDTGRRTIAAFQPEGGQTFVPAEASIEEVADESLPGDALLGEKLSLTHCGRCHVINESNRMAGLGSTPSFGALRANESWLERFQSFFARNPHPSFTQIEGITEPFDIARPPPIVPLEITIEDLEAILAYVSRMEPADLGAPVRMQ